MGLNTVALLVVVGQVEKFQCQVSPDAVQGSWVQSANVDHLVLQTQHMGRVVVLKQEKYIVEPLI